MVVSIQFATSKAKAKAIQCDNIGTKTKAQHSGKKCIITQLSPADTRAVCGGATRSYKYDYFYIAPTVHFAPFDLRTCCYKVVYPPIFTRFWRDTA